MTSDYKHPYTIVIEGNIGSGKTTFLEHFLKNHASKQIIGEPVEKWQNCQGHNLLKLMYEDPVKWGMLFQTYVQLTMAQEHTSPTDKEVRIMERSLLRKKLEKFFFLL